MVEKGYAHRFLSRLTNETATQYSDGVFQDHIDLLLRETVVSQSEGLSRRFSFMICRSNSCTCCSCIMPQTLTPRWENRDSRKRPMRAGGRLRS